MYSCFHCKTRHNRCFFWFPAAQMCTNIASPYKALYIWENHFFLHLKSCTDLNLGKELRIFVSFHFPDSSLFIEQF